jgi:[NiFe] hydrogenase large subunit/hydrogenase large subunit
MTRVVVDPVTRIEGHLRIEAEVDGGAVKNAWSSSTMFRGVEIILKGRDPRDAWAFTQRFCGVCTTVHSIASIRAVEDAIGAEPPSNARLLRNLIMASQMVQDHVVHFYHLHALDWVDITRALEADPVATSKLAESISDWPLSSPNYFRGVKQRLAQFVDRGQLGPFANAYWGHPAYRLPPEANLLAVAHYLEALDWQREFIKIHAVLGGKNPHLQSFLVGGMATPVDPDRQASINMTSINAMRKLIREAARFVEKVYIPDLLAVASFYKDWAGYGAGVGNYLAYGEYPEVDGPNAPLFLPRGVIRAKDLSNVEPMDPTKITEYVTHSWYEYSAGDDQSLHPYDGETRPNYTGPEPPYELLNTDGKYSWLKSPRYDGLPMEVGPLSRMLVAYASGQRRCSPPWGGWRRAVSRPWSWPRRWRSGSTSWRTTWGVASWRSTTTPNGTRAPGPKTAPVPASTRPRAARSDIGCTSSTARSPTIRRSCRALGTVARGTRRDSGDPTKRP